MTGIINGGSAALARPAHGNVVASKAAHGGKPSVVAVKAASTKPASSGAMDCHDMNDTKTANSSKSSDSKSSTGKATDMAAIMSM
jgi:hypothetical protein